MTIHRLSVQLANQIAAGEVVERQSSVVKELVENSIDAGARTIRCALEGAGRVSIRVTDDGSGIPAEELALALAPHATSKIATAEDLNAIVTLGFRGEALASIASVTRLTLTSRTAAEADGYQVSCEGPEMNPIVVPSPHGVGTTVEARELFFNTPARRRFLRSDRTELGRIREVITRAALAHPEISFELVCDDKCVLKAQVASDEKQKLRRIAALAGPEFSSGFESIAVADPLLSIEGLVLPPGDSAQGGAEKVFLFLNGRPIADKTVMHAVREAFGSFGGKSAARCVLFLRCDPSSVDVNVHPRKDEVRFHHAAQIHDFISQSLIGVLNRFALSASAEAPATPAMQDAAENEGGGPSVPAMPETPARLPSFPGGQGSFVRAARPAPPEESERQQQNFRSQTRAHATALRAEILVGDDPALSAPAAAAGKGEVSLIEMAMPDVAFVRCAGNYYLVRLDALRAQIRGRRFREAVEEDRVERYQLLMPFALKLDPQLLKALKVSLQSAARCGFELEISRSQVTMSAVPAELKGADLAGICQKAFALIASSDELTKGRCPAQLAFLIGGGNGKTVTDAEGSALLAAATAGDLRELVGAGACDLRVNAQARALMGL